MCGGTEPGAVCKPASTELRLTSDGAAAVEALVDAGRVVSESAASGTLARSSMSLAASSSSMSSDGPDAAASLREVQSVTSGVLHHRLLERRREVFGVVRFPAAPRIASLVSGKPNLLSNSGSARRVAMTSLRVFNTEDFQRAAQPLDMALDARLTGKQVLGDHSRFRRPSTLEIGVSQMPLRGGDPVVESCIHIHVHQLEERRHERGAGRQTSRGSAAASSNAASNNAASTRISRHA